MAVVKDAVNSLLDKLHLTSHEHEPSEEQLKELKGKYDSQDQGQVFAFYEKLSASEQASLFGQLSRCDPKHINGLAGKALHPPKTGNDVKPTLEPLPDHATSSVLDSKPEDLAEWYSSGVHLIAQNKVAVVLMAGGQGTRLGSSAPKGCFDIGLPSKKSLFQLQGERIAKAELLAREQHGSEATIPWYVMTSGPTRPPTEKFFEEHQYFGLKKENVCIFEQGVLPCISNEGKILLESKSKVCRSKSFHRLRQRH